MRVLRMLTFNVWAIRGRSLGARTTPARLSALGERVRALAPDVLLVQELWRGAEHRQFVTACGLPHAAASDAYRSDDVLEAGLAILARHPLSDVEVREYAAQEPGGRTRRAALLATVAPVGGPPLRVVCTHLTSNDLARPGDRRSPEGERMFLAGPTHDPREPLRRAQLRELGTWLAAEATRPVLLGGDLNTGPQYPLFWEWLADLARRHPALHATRSRTPRLPATYDNAWAALGRGEGQLDHLIGWGGAKVLRTEVVLTGPVPLPAPPGLGPLLERVLRFRDLAPWTRTFAAPVSDHHGLLAEVGVPG